MRQRGWCARGRELPNTEGRLRDGLFGRARIAEELEVSGLTAPVEAVQIVDARPVVFVELEDDLYETRVVRLGPEHSGRMAILEGLSADERIAMAETYVLKSELLKARLGAGCVDH